ncbi:30S ribosomal protein S20 [Candidatus Azambacteria bacterium]|nr:30S ribosomal protein S20 [Candidatus Azambacteria bacterium]
MPITSSAQKTLRQSLKKRKHNLSYINKFKKLRTQIKKLVSAQKKYEAKAILPSIYKVLDKGAKEKVFKKNTSSRYKSRITLLLNKK